MDGKGRINKNLYLPELLEPNSERYINKGTTVFAVDPLFIWYAASGALAMKLVCHRVAANLGFAPTII